MSTMGQMTEDLALIMLSHDLTKKYGKTVVLESWPTKDEMTGAAFVDEQVRIDWAENIKDIYRTQAEPLVFRLRAAGYGSKTP